MTIYNVNAQAYSKKTKRPLAKARDELIDTSTNRLFEEARNSEDVKRIYEEFWAIDSLSPEVVRVNRVSKLE